MKNNNLVTILIALVVIIGLVLYFNSHKEKTTLKGNAEDSKNENSIISEKVLKSLENSGINKNDIETSSYNIYPEYNWDNGKQELKGYRTSNILKVKTKDFSKIGKIVDVSVDNGATLIQSINFELSQEKQNEIKQEAISKASEDARIKANATAQGLNAKLGKVKQ